MGGRAAKAFRDPATLVVGALAVHRITRLATDDELTRPARERLIRWAEGTATRRAHPQLAFLVTCPWCVSVYAAAAWAALVAAAPAVSRPAGAVLAWSSVTGLLSSWE